MKELHVHEITGHSLVPAKDIPALLDENHIEFQAIDCVNWKDYPYRPEVEFRIAHTGDAILLNYRVKEESVRAVAAEDNGRVWEDRQQFYVHLHSLYGGGESSSRRVPDRRFVSFGTCRRYLGHSHLL